MKIPVKKMILSGMFLALCIVLPFLTMQIPQLGSALLPMHLPVLLCGFICGGPYGLVVGAVAPVLRSAIFGMPPMFPTAAAMAFELAVYGLMSGFLLRALPKKNLSVYVSLIAAMITGRIVWGAVSWLFYGLAGTAFTWQIFISGAVMNALPGIAIQIVLVPLLIIALRRAKLIDNEGIRADGEPAVSSLQ